MDIDARLPNFWSGLIAAAPAPRLNHTYRSTYRAGLTPSPDPWRLIHWKMARVSCWAVPFPIQESLGQLRHCHVEKSLRFGAEYRCDCTSCLVPRRTVDYTKWSRRSPGCLLTRDYGDHFPEAGSRTACHRSLRLPSSNVRSLFAKPRVGTLARRGRSKLAPIRVSLPVFASQ